MKFRFVIEDSSDSGNVEAGIDDIEIVDILPGCKIPDLPGSDPNAPGAMPGGNADEQGCGCTQMSRGVGLEQAVIMTLCLFGLLRIRRRRT